MTSPARRREAEQVSILYHAVLTKMGVAASIEALPLLPANAASMTSRGFAQYIRQVLVLVTRRRAEARDLFIAYYRLHRALVTGHTVSHPLRPQSRVDTLDRLREEFYDVVGPWAGEIPHRPRIEVPEGGLDAPGEVPDPSAIEESGPDAVETDVIEWDLAEVERDAATSATEVMSGHVQDMLEELARLEEQEQADRDGRRRRSRIEADRIYREEMLRIKEAREVEKAVMNGARDLEGRTFRRDRRQVAWARIPGSPHPCGWCAALASRGAVYKSAQAAIAPDGSLYHPNCQCHAIALYTRAQQDESELLGPGREMREFWDEHIAGKFFGKEAINAMRREMNRRRARASYDRVEPNAA